MKRIFTLFCQLFLCAAALPTIARAQAVSQNDSMVLVDLYKSTGGPNWVRNTNWLSGPVSTWYGVTVTGDRVTHIALGFNNLSGKLPASIVKLDMLNELSLSFNDLNGDVPATIDKLQNLKNLNLAGNYLTGGIPASITRLKNLENLYLDFNILTGAIPEDIGNLSNLIVLELEHNQLSGTIPASVNQLTKLYGLYLNYNQFSGALPFLGNLTNLSSLYANNNQLTGSVPEYFRDLKRLSILNLSYNQLSQESNVDFPLATPRQTITVYLNNNRFTFNGLEFVASKFQQAYYAPQAKIRLQRQGNTLLASAGGTLSNNTYLWFKAGVKGSKAVKADSTFTPTESGRYYVQVKNSVATRLTLFSDTLEVSVATITNSGRKAPVATATSATGTKMQVYPSPANNWINVTVAGTAQIILTNAAGNVVLQRTVAGNERVDVSALANGLYFIQNKTTKEVQKIFVSH